MAESVTCASGGYWVTRNGAHSRALFAVEGMRCAACARSVERALLALPGVRLASVNPATAHVTVEWTPADVGLPRLLAAIEQAGFHPVSLSGSGAEQAWQQEWRQALKRVGLAGLGMMQVMMYVFGVYVAPDGSIDPAIATYLRVTGMLITTPVLLYSGAPFLLGAVRNIRQRTLGMDLPVAIALCLAYGASVINTLRGTGQTYFDSVTMFIFFLGTGRLIERTVRQRSLALNEAIGRSMPALVTRRNAAGVSERVPVGSVVAGDRLVVARGAVIPVDAVLAEGSALVDESLVTGEARPVRRASGDLLPGGGLNVGDPIEITARRDVAHSTLASIIALLERAQADKPGVTTHAARLAGWLVGGTLALAAVTALVWLWIEPSRAMPAALAVLVVTCPCALSLATPVAVAAASTRLARRGLLVTRADALERLAGVDTVLLDKTGTLTAATASVDVLELTPPWTREEVLRIAAALERDSLHPIARAFAAHAAPACVASGCQERAGAGVAGVMGGETWRLGRRSYVSELSGGSGHGPDPDGVFLGNQSGIVALFQPAESLRPGAAAAVAGLRQAGLAVSIASGDQQPAVEQVAQGLGLAHAAARLQPADKTGLVRSLQRDGHRVLAVGDGINDAPVLALADVSCAMGQGSAIAQAAADLLLLNDRLDPIAEAVAVSRSMMRVVRRNLRWALFYNLAAVPLAALNLVPPWLAALGMSVSSLVVVLSARGLARSR
ncbi:MAG TPA: cation-translocating P-type ATPase [Steroidobacteraceae bacterium]|nr:cation-translocating P-type ATPase [Steroidobacteraceae bacterium]